MNKNKLLDLVKKINPNARQVTNEMRADELSDKQIKAQAKKLEQKQEAARGVQRKATEEEHAEYMRTWGKLD